MMFIKYLTPKLKTWIMEINKNMYYSNLIIINRY